MSDFNENNQEFAPENKPVENTTEPTAPANEPLFFTDGAEVVSGVEVAKKGPGKIIAVIVAAVVLLFGCGFASYAFIPQVKNTVKMLLNSPEEYYAWVEKENTDDFEWVTEMSEQLDTHNSVANAAINLDSKALENLMVENGMSLEEAGFKIPSTIGMDVKATEIDGVSIANESISIDGKPLITYNAYVNDGKIYYQIPELTSSYICMDFAKIMDMATAESENETVNALLESAITSLLTDTSEDEEVVSDEEFRQLLVKYTEILFTSAKNVELVKNAECEADGVKCEYNKLVVNIDEGSLYTFAKKAVKELKNEQVVIDIAEALGVTKEEYQTAIDELSEQLGTYEISGGETLCVMNVYVNSKGEIVGRDFVNAENAEDEFNVGYVLTNDSNKYGFTAYADIDAEVLTVNGNATEKSGSLTGEAKISYNNSDVFGLTFKDFECDDEFVKGSVTLGLSALELDDMTLNFGVKDDKQTFDTAFTYEGTKLFDITMEMSDEKPESITVFNDAAKVYDFTESVESNTVLDEYMAEADIETFARNLVDILGIDEQYANSFVEGITQGFAGSLSGDVFPDTESDTDFEIIDEDTDFSEEDPYIESSAEYDFKNIKAEVGGKAVNFSSGVEIPLDNIKFESDTVEPDEYCYGYDDEYTMSVTVFNESDKAASPAECIITNFSINEEAGVDVKVDGLTFGDDIDKLTEKYGLEFADRSSGFADVVDPTNYQYITFYYMDGKIYEISFLL